MHGAAVESAERICRNFRDSGSTPETWVGLLEGMERTTLMLMIDEVRYRQTKTRRSDHCRQLYKSSWLTSSVFAPHSFQHLARLHKTFCWYIQ